MFRFLKIYSIDVALGAVVGAWFFSIVALVGLPWYIYIIIALIVWSIYTGDHLLDALKFDSIQGPDRYLYHRKYFYPAMVIVVAALAISLLLAFFLLPQVLLVTGFILGGVVIFYFLLRILLPSVFAGLKELIAAVVYTSGLALPAYYYMHSFSFFFIVVGLQFFCIVFGNLLTCAMWDESLDKLNSYGSMVVALGQKFIRIIFYSLIAISAFSAVSGIILLTGHKLNIQIIILLMNTGLILGYFFGSKMKEHTQRLVIDCIFFIPLLLFML